MATTRSEDEVENAYLSSMGQELGAAFFQLYRKLTELHIVWQQYRQLFGTDSRTVQLLNRTAGLFFKIIQDELWDSVLLAISRMTDPPNTSGRKNLTIQSLPSLIENPGLRAEVHDLCKAAVDDVAFAREHRDKRIAHQDHGYTTDRSSHPLNGVSRERVESMLESLRRVMNRLELHFAHTTVMYEGFVDESGAGLLVYRLKKLERLTAT